MPFRTMDVREQRVQFVVAAIRKEKPFRTLCKEFGVSTPTGRLWLRRYRAQGIEGIAERSRRPHHSPRKTSTGIEERVVETGERVGDVLAIAKGVAPGELVVARNGSELKDGTSVE